MRPVSAKALQHLCLLGKFEYIMKKPLLRGLVCTAKLSARRPVYTVTISIVITRFFAIVGLFTNFRIENEGSIIWTPTGCTSLIRGDGVASKESTSPLQPARNMQVIVANRTFDVMDTVRLTPGYTGFCSPGRGNVDGESLPNAATRFWAGYDCVLLEEEVDSD